MRGKRALIVQFISNQLAQIFPTSQAPIMRYRPTANEILSLRQLSRTPLPSGVTAYMSNCSRRRSGIGSSRYAMQPVSLNGAAECKEGEGRRMW